MKHNHYARLAAMTVLSFLSMYVFMYWMVNASRDVYNSLNQVYMAGVMTAAMVVIELLVMSGVSNKKLNAALIAIGVAAGTACFALVGASSPMVTASSCAR